MLLRPSAFILALLLLSLPVLLGACAVERPPGFTLAVTVYAPADQPPQQPRALRPARYVIESDSALRAATGPMFGRPGFQFPPLVRRLSPSQMEVLWHHARAANLVAAAHPSLIHGPVPVPADVEITTAIFEVTTDFQPRIFVVQLDDDAPGATATRALLDYLAELAWVQP